MKVLTASDRRHLDAMDGWLELDNFCEAKAELMAVGPDKASNPEVLRALSRLFMAAAYWPGVLQAAPFVCRHYPDELEGYIHLATALHESNRTVEAHEVLLKVVDKFPDAYPVPYALACYAGRLGHVEESLMWWKKVQALTTSEQVMELAHTEPDLRALWVD
jgi:hypothetical protein